ncbi:uncharacterized protein N7459_009499 [Penicillium hispanicum]|uniref:uncharacterized protein n=1 Tax=Penicillium hispanicum TaxID=1080232 RepID=UPI00253FFC82|nr:uncharacterized protein N7459_009499 [Penicillium hispanicum]KAJ5570069.1 hypothetical protein N7459_009499 [Penicillium hispanicum]
MSLDEEALGVVANGGSLDSEKWASMVSPLLERLEHIVYNMFPMPKAPPTLFESQPIPQPLTQASDVPPESSNKENSAPGGPQASPNPQPTTGSPQSSERVPYSQPQPTSPAGDTLPPPLALILASIRSAIQSFFVEKPPHTIQRLAELILRPTAHYRTLPAYLRAVDRVVSVTSGADVFPFSTPANTSTQSNGLVHSTNSAGTYLTPDHAHGLGSDESLGGALLTPIPWLTSTPFEGEDGNALEEEETAPAHGEELISGAADSLTAAESEEAGAPSGSPPAEASEEVPHARGPPVVGVEDLGLQDGKGVEMNLGAEGKQDVVTGDDVPNSDPPATETPQGSGEAATSDKDGDIVLGDTKPKDGDSATEETTEAAPPSGVERSETVGDSAVSGSEKE